MRARLLSTTAVAPLPSRILGGLANPWRILRTSRGRFVVARMPNHIDLDRYIAVRRAMALAAYSGGIRPHGAPADVIQFEDRDVVERPDVYPPEYRALMQQIASEAAR